MTGRSLPGWPLAIILLVQFGILYHSSINNSPTPDELPHVISGLHHLSNGGNQFYHVNPPLVKLLAALPSVGEDVKLPLNSEFDYRKLGRPEFALGIRFFNEHPAIARKILFRARLVSIAIALLGTGGVFLLTRLLIRDQSPLASVSTLVATFASAIYSFSPFILGNAAFVQTDVTAATALVWLVIAATVWGRSKTVASIIGLGVVFGLALCTKYTLWIGFAILPLFLFLGDTTLPAIARGIVGYAGVCLLSLIIVNAVIGGQRPWQRLGDYQFVSEKLTGREDSNTAKDDSDKNRFAATHISKVLIPLPPVVLKGVDLQIKDMQENRPTRIFGETRETGVWWYYLAGLLLKTPLGFLLIAVIAVLGSVLLTSGLVAGIAEAHAWGPCHLPFVNYAGMKAFGHANAIGDSGLDWEHGWIQFSDYLKKHESQMDSEPVLITKPYWCSVDYAEIAFRKIDIEQDLDGEVLLALPATERFKMEEFSGSLFARPPIDVVAGSIEVYRVGSLEMPWIIRSVQEFRLAKSHLSSRDDDAKFSEGNVE